MYSESVTVALGFQRYEKPERPWMGVGVVGAAEEVQNSSSEAAKKAIPTTHTRISVRLRAAVG